MPWTHYTTWLTDGQRITAAQLRELMAALGERLLMIYADFDAAAADEIQSLRLLSTRIRFSRSAGFTSPTGLLATGISAPAGFTTETMRQALVRISPAFVASRPATAPGASSTGTGALALYTNASALSPAGSGTVQAAAEAMLTTAGAPCSWLEFVALDDARLDSPRRWNFYRAWIRALDWLGLGTGVAFAGFNSRIFTATSSGSKPWLDALNAVRTATPTLSALSSSGTQAAYYGAQSAGNAGSPPEWYADLRAQRLEVALRAPVYSRWAGGEVTFYQRNGMQAGYSLGTGRPDSYAAYSWNAGETLIGGSGLYLSAATWTRAVATIGFGLPGYLSAQPPGWEYGTSETRPATAVDFGASGDPAGVTQFEVGYETAARPLWLYN